MPYNLHNMRPVRPDQEDALEYLQEVKTWMDEYPKALEECIRAGVSNVRMASILGKTEAAVRMYRKRHGL